MKCWKKRILLLFATVLAAVCLVLAACGSTVKLTFETNGGPEVAAVEIEKGTEHTLPTPEREGYSFEGWYSDAEFSGSPVTVYSGESDQTFYAKWEKLYLVTLDAGGGTLAENSFYLKEGENLSDALKDRIPTRSGFEFGTWQIDGKDLGAGERMPQSDLTLTARYKVGYTVEIYQQSLENLSEYEKADSVVGYEYADGKEFAPTVEREGFTLVPHEGEVRSKALTETPSQNVFSLYFDRKEVSVSLMSNFPADSGVSDFVPLELKGLYGAQTTLPEDGFVCGGYCLVGWSAHVWGDDPFPSNYIAERLYGGNGEAVYRYTFTESGPLYAVWKKAYIDRFEGNDLIYFFEETEEGDAKIYLDRSGVFFLGEYEPSANGTKGFVFYGEDEKPLLEGVLNDNGTFTYYDANRNGSRVLYVPGIGIDETTKILLNEYDGITYTVSGENGTERSEGTYGYAGNGEYTATFTSGELQGQTIFFTQGYIQNENGVTTSAFSVRDEKAFGLGVIPCALIYSGQLTYYTQNLYAVVLDGYGVAAMNMGDQVLAFYYLLDGDTLRLFSTSDGTLIETEELIQINGVTAYFTYTSEMEGEYQGENGATLSLDGLYNATYVSGGETFEGYYSVSGSALSRNLVTVTSENTVKVFRVQIATENVDGQTVLVRTFEEVCSAYSEYYYLDEDNYYREPLIVLDEAEKGKITLYARVTTGGYQLLAEGSYTVNEETGFLQATISKHYEGEFRAMPVDVANIESFVFSTAYISTSSASAIPVAYWYSTTDLAGNSSRYDKQYKQLNGDGQETDGTLTLVAGFAILDVTEEGEKIHLIGSAVRSENILVIVTSAGNLAVELDEEQRTFLVLSSLMGTVDSIDEYGRENRNEFFMFDGKGGVVYSVVTPAAEEGEDNQVTSYDGSFEAIEERTVFGDTVYRFTADNGSVIFDFLLIQLDSQYFFTKEKPSYAGEYKTESGDVLTLDGFGFAARYVVAGGNAYSGIYCLYEENVICFMNSAGSETFYFDVVDEGTVTRRGVEFASYLILRNQEILEESVELGGYGKLTVYRNQDGERTEVGKGTYEIHENGLLTLSYQVGEKLTTFVGAIGYMEISSTYYNTFFVQYEEFATLFVNKKDHSTLLLDGFGNAVLSDRYGKIESGEYVVISDALLYYSNTAGTEACIFVYDTQDGSIVPNNFIPRGYYTQDLESMRFTDYGFMIFGGETRYYYNVFEDGTVKIYHRDDSDEKSNAYGFVEEDFGKFTEQKEWKGKTYYLNNGYALRFTRREDSKDKYPLPVQTLTGTEKHAIEELTFTPGGGTEFSVRGSVTIAGTTMACVVTRTVENDIPRLTVTVGAFRLTIEVNYAGEHEDGTSDNTYAVTALERYVQTPASQFLYFYYMMAVYQGIGINNTFGVITITDTYDEGGEVVSRKATGEFGVSSGMTDSADATVSFTDADYTEQSNIYTVDIEGSDGLHYRLHFQITNTFYSIFGLYSYDVVAFTLAEELTAQADGSEYTLEIERVIVSDLTRYRAGGLFNVDVKKGGESIPCTIAFMRTSAQLTYVVRQQDESGRYTTAEYYVFDLTEEASDEEGEAGDEEDLPHYLSATLQIKHIRTVTGASADVYADVNEAEKTVELVHFDGAYYYIEKTDADENGVYHATSTGGAEFSIDEKENKISKLN